MFRYIYGFVKIRICHVHPETVINGIMEHIVIDEIIRIDDTHVEFCTRLYLKNKAVAVISECGALYEIVTEKGIPAFLLRYKKRWGFMIGCVLSVAFIIISSNMIWDIRISGNIDVTDSDILNGLEKLGVKVGSFQNKEELERIYNDFLINEPNIAWISINYDGTIAKVEVNEAQFGPERLDRSKNTNIIAKCDGVVKRIDVFDGNAEVTSGDTVIEGELLISSFTESKKNGSFLRGARGNVWALTERCFEVTISKEISKRINNNNTINERELEFIGTKFQIGFGNDFGRFMYRSVCVSNDIVLFGVYRLPLKFTETKLSEYTVVNKCITAEEAKELAEAELEFRIKRELADAKIIEKTVEYIEEDNEYVYIFKLECLENIAYESEFEFE